MKKKNRVWISMVLSITCLLSQVYPVDARDVEKEKQSVYSTDQFVNNEVLVKMKKSCSVTERNRIFKKLNLSLVDEMDQYAVGKAATKGCLKNTVYSLEHNTYVELVQPNFEYQSQEAMYEETYTSGDITFSQNQWALKNDGTLKFTDRYAKEVVQGVNGMDLNVEPLWKAVKEKKSKTVVVAVIDSGIDINHPALKGKIWVNKKEIPGDGIDNDENGYVDDYTGWNAYGYSDDLTDEMGHGTHCAGIIAADGVDNVWGVTGKSNIKIMPIKVFCDKKDAKKGECTANSFSILRGIKYAYYNGASVCSLSLGMTSNDEAIESYMYSSKMLFVCAAGNSGESMEEEPIYPGIYRFPNVISVGNIRCDGKLHMTSSYSKKYVDVAAPGTEIYSTLPDSTYGFSTGTSMATPYVAGVAALLYSYSDKMCASSAKKQIVKNATKTSDLNGKVSSGLVNAYQAYKNDVSAPYIRYQTTVYKQKGNARVTLNVVDYGIAGVKYVRWLKGSNKVTAFKKGAKGYKVSAAGYFTAKSTGTYTIYAVDKKGNETIKKITVKIPAKKRS